jgi:hypothetical protein
MRFSRVIPLPFELVPRGDLKKLLVNTLMIPKLHEQMRSQGKDLPRKVSFSCPTSIHRIVFGDDGDEIEFSSYDEIVSFFQDDHKLDKKKSVVIISPGTKIIHEAEKEITTVYLYFKIFCSRGYLRWPLTPGRKTEEKIVNGRIVEVPKDDEPLWIS